MFVIRQEQIAQMMAAMEHEYYERLRKLFRERFPGLVIRLDDPALLEQIGRASCRERVFGYV